MLANLSYSQERSNSNKKITLIEYKSLDKHLDKLAQFPGGEDGLRDYFEVFFSDFSQNIIAEIDGPVEIQFIVNGIDGRVSYSVIYSKKSDTQPPGFKDEGISAVNRMPNWRPADKDGYRVHSNHLVTLGIQQKHKAKQKPPVGEIEIPDDPVLIGMETIEHEKSNEDPDFIHKAVESPPQYPGGKEALNEYIKSKIVKPIKINNPDLTGEIIVDFVVRKSGKISDVAILNDLCTPCGKLTKKQIGAMPVWKPGRQNGEKVNVKSSLLIKL